METRKRSKRIKLDDDFIADLDELSNSSRNHDPGDLDEVRKSKIRDSNKEYARRMTILQTWSDYWGDYTTRQGEAYPLAQAKDIIKRLKRISCPIETCKRSYTTIPGLKYHYARCNIVRSFKCLVCKNLTEVSTRGELLRHMILNHCDELPPLNDEQKEIANSYSFESRLDRQKSHARKPGAEFENTLSSSNVVKCFNELKEKEYEEEKFSQRPFRNWQTLAKDWELLSSEFDRKRYYPPETESVKFKTATEEEWIQLKTCQSVTLNTATGRGTLASKIFFTGGVNTSSAWLPKSHLDPHSNETPDLVAISVHCYSMGLSRTYAESQEGEGCIQFWSVSKQQSEGCDDMNAEIKVFPSYMIGHRYGTIFEMQWCPLGASWQSEVDLSQHGAIARVGLLALACGDGKVRILGVPRTDTLLSKVTVKKEQLQDTMETLPLFRVKPIATLIAPGVGPSTDYQAVACKTICWNIQDNQRLIAAGYANGNVALFDLANHSPILYTDNENHHVYRPLKAWIAHGGPVTGIAISSYSIENTLIATGSTDRLLKVWNAMDLSSSISTDRAPITKILWDYRLRGLLTATDTAFTSFVNRVSYRYPTADGNNNITISTHRSTVWGLANSIITNSLATSDAAGEVFVIPQLATYRSSHKRERNLLSTHSLYTMLPRALNDSDKEPVIQCAATSSHEDLNEVTTTNNKNIVNGGPMEENGNNINNGILEVDADFSAAERDVANKPTHFLLPIEHRPIQTYSDFKTNFGLQFTNYDSNVTLQSRIPESCLRASSVTSIYCDRPCDYPFSSINTISWSPNVKTFSFLLSGTEVGLCRLDRIHSVEHIYKNHLLN